MSDSNNLTGTITELEHQTWKALQKSGEDFLPFLSKDCIMLFPLGLKVSNSTTPNLHSVLTSEAFEPWVSYDMRDVEVTPIGTEGAVISYNAKAVRQGTDEPFRAMISSIWRKDAESDRWLLCLHQQTPFTAIDLGAVA